MYDPNSKTTYDLAKDIYRAANSQPIVQGSSNTPTDKQLRIWGVTRDQYRSLYNKAKTDWTSETGFLARILKGDPTNEINAYLKKQMEATNGAYADTVLDRKFSTQNADAPALTDAAGSNRVSTGGGGGVSVANAALPTEEIELYTAKELAEKFGITTDYATILKELNAATEAGFAEIDNTIRKSESSNLRGQESIYNQYLQDLRSRSANAVSSGATKGAMAANALAILMGFQDANREGVNTLNSLIGESALKKATALREDATLARDRETQIGTALGNMSINKNTNDINKYAAELAAMATTRSAAIGANGQIGAANIGANASSRQYAEMLDILKRDYTGKGYEQAAAGNMANADLANFIRNNNQSLTK